MARALDRASAQTKEQPPIPQLSGIHVTSQLNKIAERYLKRCVEPYMLARTAYGPRQFAYLPERGARDVLTYLVAVWILAISTGHKVTIFCSDVAGAFDKVSASRLLAKLRAK